MPNPIIATARTGRTTPCKGDPKPIEIANDLLRLIGKIVFEQFAAIRHGQDRTDHVVHIGDAAEGQ